MLQSNIFVGSFLVSKSLNVTGNEKKKGSTDLILSLSHAKVYTNVYTLKL